MRRLAVGGMAEVYLATLAGPRGFEKKVVVKQILPQLAREPELLQLFFDEAAIARRLAHPGIVQVFDVGQHDGTHYIAMEFVDGLDLDDLIRREVRATGRGLPVPLAVRVVLDLARAVHYAHEALDEDGSPLDVIHRDISPQNVLLGRDGSVKLGDFGIARTNLRARHTQTGVLRGKISYLAPERFAGERASRGVDVYAMGVVLYECIAGKRPFVGDDAALIKKIIHEPTPLLSTAVPGVDPRIESLVAEAMAHDPARRLPSARALAEGLSSLGVASALAELGHYVSTLADRAAQTPAAIAGPVSAPPRSRARSTETLPGRLDDPDASLVAEAALRAETVATPPRDEAARGLPVEVTTAAPSAALFAAVVEPTRAMPLEGPEETRIASPPVEPRPRTTSRLIDTARQRPLLAVAGVCAAGVVAGWVATQLWMPQEASRDGGGGAAVVEREAHRLAPVPIAANPSEAGPPPSDRVDRAVPEIGDRALDPLAARRAVAPLPEGDADDGAEPVDPSPPAEAAADPARKQVRRVRKTPRPRPTVSAVASAAPTGRVEGGEGELSIDAEPWAYVLIDGRSLGATPLAHVRLPAGTHRVRLENPESRQARMVSITIRDQQRTAVRIRMSDGTTLRP